MLNKIKNELKLFLRFYELRQITFSDYSEYKEYFVEEDKKSTWDPSAFSNIIEKHLNNKSAQY